MRYYYLLYCVNEDIAIDIRGMKLLYARAARLLRAAGYTFSGDALSALGVEVGSDCEFFRTKCGTTPVINLNAPNGLFLLSALWRRSGYGEQGFARPFRVLHFSICVSNILLTYPKSSHSNFTLYRRSESHTFKRAVRLA